MFRQVPQTDFVVILTVSLVTIIFHSLAVAVLIGVVISALKFAWENALRIRARKRVDENGAKHCEIYGPLFFGSVGLFQEKLKVAEDPEAVMIDCDESRVVDHSAIEALNKVTERYAKVGKKVHLKHLSSDCRQILDTASAIVDVNYWEDPHYKLVSDELA